MKLRFQHERLKALREKLGLSQYDFGRRIGQPPQVISQYEQGKYAPRMKTIVRILNEFSLPADYFFAHSNSPTDNKKVKA